MSRPWPGSYLVRDESPDRLCRIGCLKCDRAGAYRRETLVERFGLDWPMPDVLLKLAKATCPRHGSFSNPCGAVFLDPLGATPPERARLAAEVEAARLARAAEPAQGPPNSTAP